MPGRLLSKRLSELSTTKGDVARLSSGGDDTRSVWPSGSEWSVSRRCMFLVPVQAVV
jgi:hypothetical protein